MNDYSCPLFQRQIMHSCLYGQACPDEYGYMRMHWPALYPKLMSSLELLDIAGDLN